MTSTFGVEMATVYLRKHLSFWYIENADGTIITGPHQWGTTNRAMHAAMAFCSTWNWQVILKEDPDEQSEQQDPVPAKDGPG